MDIIDNKDKDFWNNDKLKLVTKNNKFDLTSGKGKENQQKQGDLAKNLEQVLNGYLNFDKSNFLSVFQSN